MNEIKSVKIGSASIEANLKAVKKNNTTIKNLKVEIEHEGQVIHSEVIPNIYKVWRFIKSYYNEDAKNMSDKVKVYLANGTLTHDIHAERKSSGALWTVNSLNFGKNKKKENE